MWLIKGDTRSLDYSSNGKKHGEWNGNWGTVARYGDQGFARKLGLLWQSL